MVAIVKESSVPLLPCPFCGGTDLHIEGDNASDVWGVECNGCDASGPRVAPSPDAAAEAWNRALRP